MVQTAIKQFLIQFNIDIYLVAVCVHTIYKDTNYHKLYLASCFYLTLDVFS